MTKLLRSVWHPQSAGREFLIDAQEEKPWRAFLRKGAIDSLSPATLTADCAIL
jgi:hypothetical protein